jgi:hypothetical protein
MTPFAYEALRAVAAEKPDEIDEIDEEPRGRSRWRLFGRRTEASRADGRS